MTLIFLHEPDQIVAKLLVDVGLGSDPAPMRMGGTPNPWPVFYSREPSSPDDVLTVYHTADRADYREMVTGEQQLHLGIQIRIRARDEATGKTKARAVREYLAKTAYLTHVAIGSALYLVWSFVNFNLIDLGDNVPSTKRNVSTINCMTCIDRLT